MFSLREYMYDLMTDKRQDPLSCAIKACLLLISYAYGALIALHHFFYKVNLLKSYEAKIPVISVGNITLGGTGKTPFVITLAKKLSQKTNVGVLIRGYGEDEWKMLEGALGGNGAQILVGRDRVKNAKRAEASAGCLILDDGFQHRRLKRDLDIVLVNCASPFGNEHLFPRGILREPKKSLKRASIIVLTKIDNARGAMTEIEKTLKKLAPGKPIMKAKHKPKSLSDIQKKNQYELSFINSKRACLLSAICDPSYFRYTVEAAGAHVEAEFIFPDHHTYKTYDLKRIFEECKNKNIDTIITTEKDAVKLKDLTLPEEKVLVLVLTIEFAITEGEKALDDEIYRLYMRHSRKKP